MSEEQTAIQKTAARMAKLLERKTPEGVEVPGCGHLHYCGRSEPFYSFTLDALDKKGDDYEAMSELIHDDAPDSDAGYEWLADVLDAIEDGTISDEDDISEWADSATPVYTFDLLRWMAESTYRLALITDMQAEYGTDGTTNNSGGGAMLMAAYCYGLDRFARQVWYAVEKLAEAQEDGEEASE